MTRILAYLLPLIAVIATAMLNASAIAPEKSQSKSGKHQVIAKRQKSDKQTSKVETQKQNNKDTQRLNKLIDSAQSYKDNPSNETYTELWQDFENWVHQLAVRHTDASSLCKSCQPLSKAGLKIIDAAGGGGTVKIYTFSPHAIWAQSKSSQATQQSNIKPEIKPLVPPISRTAIETRDILVQSLEPTEPECNGRLEKRRLHGKIKRSHLRAARAKKAAAMHTQSINIPPNVEIKQACLLNGSAAAKNRFLAILGLDWQSGHCWLEGLKHTSTGWAHDANLCQQVPSFLLQTGQGKVRLSDNNLVITIGSHGAADNNGSSASYELVMPFVENRFAFTRNEAQDPPRAVALQFLLAIQGKRADLARIWLADPQLASIPGYLGLYNRPAGSPALKLISMPPPLSGGARFRLITNSKDDLIVDVARIKGQWLVKGLFIAPADSLAAQIGRILPTR